MAPRTTKERNTQRRKRLRGLEHKAYEYGKLCGFDVALIMYNSEKGEYYMYSSTHDESWPPSKEQLAHAKVQIKFPEDVEGTKLKKSSSTTRTTKRKGLRKVTKVIMHEESTQASTSTALGRLATRAASFLPDPPSFDLTRFKKSIG